MIDVSWILLKFRRIGWHLLVGRVVVVVVVVVVVDVIVADVVDVVVVVDVLVVDVVVDVVAVEVVAVDEVNVDVVSVVGTGRGLIDSATITTAITIPTSVAASINRNKHQGEYLQW